MNGAPKQVEKVASGSVTPISVPATRAAERVLDMHDDLAAANRELQGALERLNEAQEQMTGELREAQAKLSLLEARLAESQSQQAALEAKLTAFEQSRGAQVVVLMVPTTRPEDDR